MDWNKSISNIRFFKAIKEGDIANFTKILNQYPDFIDQKAADGWTPLETAYFNGQAEIIKHLHYRIGITHNYK